MADRDYELDDEFYDVCGNIGCVDGWVADCFDGFCINAEDGCDLCTRRCDWCNVAASAIEARRAETNEDLAPSSDESAVAKPDAQKEAS